MDNFTSNNNANFFWWFGVVEDRNDPLRLGRCRIRILGYHTDDKEELPSEDLPWAIPVMPANSAGTSGVGWSPTGAVEGSWCVGFFADGEDGQHPMFFGTVGAIPGGLRGTGCDTGEGSGQSGDNAAGSSDFSDLKEPTGAAKDHEAYLEQFLDQNKDKFKNYSPMTKAAIMAQCAHETGNFRAFKEIWGPSEYQKKYEGTDTARRQGNTNPGDGFKYRGRGYIQCTWKNNYRAYSQAAGVGNLLVEDPDKILEKKYSAGFVVWFFTADGGNGRTINRKNLWHDIDAVSLRVNGTGYRSSLADRKKKFEYYKKKYGA